MQLNNLQPGYNDQTSTKEFNITGSESSVPLFNSTSQAEDAIATKEQKLVQFLRTTSDDPQVLTLSDRIEKEGVTTATLKQMDTVLENIPQESLSALTSLLSAVTKHKSSLKKAEEKLLTTLQNLNVEKQSVSIKKKEEAELSLKALISQKGDYRSLVVPASYTPVSEEQAEKSLQSVMQSPRITTNAFLTLNVEELALKAANLGIKTFSDTASAITKSQTIATDARKTLMDKQAADFTKELENAIKQQENAKKGGIFGVILKWIAPVISVVAAIFVPASLPLMIGMLGSSLLSAASATMSTVNLAMGTNAPDWLKKMSSIVDYVSTGVSFLVGAGAMWMGKAITNKIIDAIEMLTDFSSGFGGGVSKLIDSNLKKLFNELELNMSMREFMIDIYKSFSDRDAQRLESATESWGMTNQKMVDVITETSSLRARMAKNII